MEGLSLDSLEREYHKRVAVRDDLLDQVSKVQAEITHLESEDRILDMVSTCIRSLIDTEVMDGVRSIEALQTEALQAIFPDQDNRVVSEVDIKRGKVSVTFLTRREYPDGSVVEGEASNAFGGAITTVQAILFRITMILKRDMRPLLIMDETMPAISNVYLQNAVQFLSLLCKRIGMDILIVSHDPLLVESADRAYRISQDGGKATIKVIK